MSSQAEHFARVLLDHCTLLYEHEAGRWRELEGKAQATAAVAGVFVAAVFIVLQDYDRIGPIQGTLLGVVALLLPVVITFCVRALGVSDYETPEEIASLREAARVAAEEDESDPIAFAEERAEIWERSTESLSAVNDAKALNVYRAQRILVLAIGIVSLAVLLRILTAVTT